MRSYSRGGLADLRQAHAWNADFVQRSPAGQRYESLATEIDRALAFMRACGVDLDAEDTTHGVDLFASHEALLLEYESALTRADEVSGDRTTCRRTCCGSATGPASSTAPTSTWSRSSPTRSG